MSAESSTNHLIQMEKMEQFLIQFPYLQHLNLKITVAGSLFNGHRWEELTKKLSHIQFLYEALWTRFAD